MAKGCISVMVAPELEKLARDAAASEGRSLSNYVERLLERGLRLGYDAQCRAAMSAEDNPRAPIPGLGHRGGRQVDITEAIAQAVKRGPAKSKHK